MDREYELDEKKSFSYQRKNDINIIIQDLNLFKMQNAESDDFLTVIDNIKNITKEFYFEDFYAFIQYDVFNTLFLLAFPAPDKERDFLQSQSLKILKNFINYPIIKYASTLIDMGIIQKISTLLNSNSATIIKNAIKLLYSIAPINISYSQDILLFIKIKYLIHIYQKFHNNRSMKSNVIRLLYLLSRCDIKEEINDFIEFVRIKIDEMQIQNPDPGDIITIFLMSHHLMKDRYAVNIFTKMPNFVKFLNYSLSFNSGDKELNIHICQCALKTVDFIHFYDDKLINGLNYELLASFLITNNDDLSELITEIFINILASSQLVTLFVEKYNITNRLIISRRLELSYIANRNAIEAIANSILQSPNYLLYTFVEAGCVNELLDSLSIDDNALLCKILKCIDILLSQHVFDEKKNDIAMSEFLEYFDADSFETIQQNENDDVRSCLRELINNHPNYFSSDN